MAQAIRNENITHIITFPPFFAVFVVTSQFSKSSGNTLWEYTSIYVLAKVSEIFAQILFSTQLILDYCEVSESAALVFWRQHCTISELS